MPIVFVHPAEFLVTDRNGDVAQVALRGDRLHIEPDEVGGPTDSNEVFIADV